MDFMGRITWNPSDPNVLRLSMPKGVNVRTRVTRRSENVGGPDKLDTSEFIEQIFDNSSTGGMPGVWWGGVGWGGVGGGGGES